VVLINEAVLYCKAFGHDTHSFCLTEGYECFKGETWTLLLCGSMEQPRIAVLESEEMHPIADAILDWRGKHGASADPTTMLHRKLESYLRNFRTLKGSD